jgi:hypothetical protein
MSERNEFPRTLSTAIPAIPIPQENTAPATASEDEARQRIVALEKEARALGAVPAAALLFHEMGLLWENPLKHARNAAATHTAQHTSAAAQCYGCWRAASHCCQR